MTRLREIMLEELQRRNYSAITTRNYLRVVADFAKHFGKSPDKLGLNELRTYQAYLLRERKLTPGTVINQVAALRFFFVKTLKRHQFRDFLPYPQDQQVGSPTVAQSMRRNAFADAGPMGSFATCDPDGLIRDRLFAVHATRACGKQVELRLAPAPVLSQGFQ